MLAVASLPRFLAIGDDDDELVSLSRHFDYDPRRLRLFHSLTVYASLLMSMTQGHKHSASTSQNIKASLANAYQELGKELSSTKVKLIGNYTLGRVIGEGVLEVYVSVEQYVLSVTRRHLWHRQARDAQVDLHSGGDQANSKGDVRCSHQRNPPSSTSPPPPRHKTLRGHRNGVLHLAHHRALLRW